MLTLDGTRREGGAKPRGSTTLMRALLVFLLANAAYLAAFDSATILYHVQVVAHVAFGLLLVLTLIGRGPAAVRRSWARSENTWSRAAFVAVAVSSVVAIATSLVLAVTGTATPYRPILAGHVVAALLAFVAGIAWQAARGNARGARRVALVLLLALALPAGTRGSRRLFPQSAATIVNPTTPPLTPFEEGGGRNGPFFPSSVTTVGNRLIPHDFFLESKSCGNTGCHPDITAQWESSMHHFSSFNNQWYRKSIEYMQEVVGTGPSKWCGGCHDQAVLLTGRMDRPIVEQIDTPQAQAGIGCLVCHSIVAVKDTMGQGGYVLEYPEMHRLVASGNPLMHRLHDYMTRLDPGPHKATMLKPFHRESRAEFCSSCHKVHLDVPVNHYRWFRGFNEYDAWQGSGVSHQGARAFYYPEKAKDCGDCHMPLVRSADQGNRGGFVHSHRFPGANTAVPFANRDEVQLKTTRDFLTAGILTVDVFAASEAAPAARGPAGDHGASGRPEAPMGGAAPSGEEAQPTALTMFPDLPDSGDGSSRAAPARGRPSRGEAAEPPLVAPLDRADPFLRAGRTYRVDVVARTRNIGHFFPGGTVDAFDVWLELKAEDADGRVIYWSGFVEDGGTGPVEAGAHRYRSLQIDAHGNEINKRNAWATRALVYARLIPPGSADVGRFRVAIPRGARGAVTFTARMNYRKFHWYNTHFSFAGASDTGAAPGALSPDFDDRAVSFTGDTSRVSGRIKAVPDLPIVVVAEDKVVLPLLTDTGPEPGKRPAGVPAPLPVDRERWNDYGIGMLLQGDLKGAKRAFERVMAIDPQYADGFVNAGRVLVQEGDHEAAVPLLEKALAGKPDLASAHYFLALALKARGRYDEALGHLRAAAARFPRDRVVRNQIGRILFLQRRHEEAIAEFESALRVDPEDLTAHYNLMLCYRALGRVEEERREEVLYTRFKADESAQAITGAYRRLNAEQNLERQPIHEHANRYTPAKLPRADRAAGSGPAGTGRTGAR
ncbi:MAG TPA: tetratricopeptide repeat protein [Candidatus Polarisedimenticolia bacterium]|jgi:Tfp pilus assembly protein PilF|nr:tetratricopeptide repeat protein [Candidatus Polarisedimenticolia bacterium]